jgi:hypothetical protein
MGKSFSPAFQWRNYLKIFVSRTTDLERFEFTQKLPDIGLVILYFKVMVTGKGVLEP